MKIVFQLKSPRGLFRQVNVAGKAASECGKRFSSAKAPFTSNGSLFEANGKGKLQVSTQRQGQVPDFCPG